MTKLKKKDLQRIKKANEKFINSGKKKSLLKKGD